MTRNPYPGLRSFEPGDSELFFGRETETDDLRRRLRSTRFLAVVGASGSGKSSLVRCGLIPSLHAGLMSGAGDAWRVAIFRPGDDPIGQLATALDQPGLLRPDDPAQPARYALLEAGLRDSSLGLAETVRQAQLPAGTRLLLVIDQFEELFRYRRVALQRSGRSDAAAFVRLLIEAARHPDAPIYLVLTMRAEFIGECMAFDGLAEVINAGQYLIPRMSRDAMRQAIAGPAAVRGAQLAPRLLVRLLNEVGDDLDRLPVLQHALMRTWQAWERDRADGEPLDFRHYEAIGTTREALSRHAEEAWRELATPEARRLAERLWKALTETSDRGLLTRRPTALAALAAVCEAPATRLAEVIEGFRQPERGFLQPPAGKPLGPDTVIDLTHESLMRLWPRLGEWIREEARATEIYRRLLNSARQHQAGEASLWRAPELGLGLKWQATQRPNAAWAARSGNADDFALATTYLQRSRRAQTTRHALAAAGLAAVVGGLGYLAYSQAELAQARQQVVDERQEKIKTLTDQLNELTQAKKKEAAELARITPELLELRARHTALKASVEKHETTLKALESSIRTAQAERQTVANLMDLVRLSIQLKREMRNAITHTEDYTNNLKDYFEDQTEKFDRLEQKISIGENDLKNLLTELSGEHQRPEAIFQEIRRCQDQDDSAAGMSFSGPPRPSTSAQKPTAPPESKPPLTNNIKFTNESWRLSSRIQELAKELAELLDARASLENETQFLNNANRILTQRRQAIQSAVIQLHKVEQKVQAQTAELRIELSSLHRMDASLSANIEEKKSQLTAKQASIEQQQKALATMISSVRSQAEKHADLVLRTGKAKRDTEQLRWYIDREAIAHLIQSNSPDKAVNALFAIQAYRWAPFDVNDAVQPKIYNRLWQTLAAMDHRAALRFIDPAQAAEGQKVGTTQAATLVRALCDRVNRALTVAEWDQRFPKINGLPYGSACYPQKPNPCDP